MTAAATLDRLHHSAPLPPLLSQHHQHHQHHHQHYQQHQQYQPPPQPLSSPQQQQQQQPPHDDLYHSDDVGLRDTPPLEPKKVNLLPSPSPPLAIPSPEFTPESSPDPPDHQDPERKHSTTASTTGHRPRQRPHHRHRRSRNRPSQGDAVLVHFMDGGKWPEIARQAGQEPLASDDDDDDADEHHRGMITGDDPEKGAASVGSLAAIAAGALAHQGSTAQSIQSTEGERIMDGVRPNIPSIASTYAGDHRAPPSQDPSNKPEAVASPGGLPPIRQHSPKSHHPNGNAAGPITLPSITAQLGDLTHLTEQPGSADSPYPQSPPTRPPHMYAAAPNHGSPPRSPNDTFRRGLLSPSNPNNYYYSQSNHQRIAQADGTQYATAGEYSSSSTETPSTEHSAPTPSLPIDRMSIDGITNPQVGGFQCAYPGCTAQPFQTQYLLNSHANVHSSIRPHYCPVKDCPRSEGGKGFKRKNEMIRHGLVHDSPGYVCPFCPDREHKYPRPDNLQRHVRVHHVDRDKDDPKLRDVLAQRPEGPSRGRRRRGAGAPS